MLKFLNVSIGGSYEYYWNQEVAAETEPKRDLTSIELATRWARDKLRKFLLLGLELHKMTILVDLHWLMDPPGRPASRLCDHAAGLFLVILLFCQS